MNLTDKFQSSFTKRKWTKIFNKWGSRTETTNNNFIKVLTLKVSLLCPCALNNSSSRWWYLQIALLQFEKKSCLR